MALLTTMAGPRGFEPRTSAPGPAGSTAFSGCSLGGSARSAALSNLSYGPKGNVAEAKLKALRIKARKKLNELIVGLSQFRAGIPEPGQMGRAATSGVKLKIEELTWLEK